MEVKRIKGESDLQFHDGCIVDGELYFSAIGHNGLYKMNLATNVVEFVMRFEGESLWTSNLHHKVLFYKNAFYFIPFWGKGISKYDFSKKNMDFYLLSEEEVTFMGAYIYEDKILLIPGHTLDWFGFFDLKESKFIRLTTIAEKINSLTGSEYCDQTFCDIHGSYLEKDILYISIFKKNKLLLIDLKNENVVIHTFDKNKQFDNICVCDNEIWLTTFHSEVIRLDRDVCLKKIYSIDCGQDNERIFFIKKFGEELVGFSLYKCSLYFFDYKEECWKEKLMVPEGFHKTDSYNALFWGVICCKGRIYILPKSGNGMLVVNLHSRTTEFIRVQMDEEATDRIRKIYIEGWKDAVRHKTVISENAGMGRLELLLKLLADNSFEKNNLGECSNSIGKLIFERL